MAMGGSGRSSQQLQVVLHVLVIFVSVLQHTKLAVGLLSASGDAKTVRCIGREREALLIFKQDLIDDRNVLSSSWGSEEDCCKWKGVHCSNKSSGHVIKLDLTLTPMRGKKISSSLLELHHLNYLGLGNIDFEGSHIPEFIGSLTSLQFLKLPQASLGGTIPHQLGNLTNLRYLSLWGNNFVNTTNLDWLSHLSLLQHLDLSELDLSQALDWQQAINKLPSLTELHLHHCQLTTIIPSSSFPLINSSSAKSLAILDLYWNDLTPPIHNWLFNFNSSLIEIDLSFNSLRGPIPDDAFGGMTSLERLRLHDSLIEGISPDAFGNMISLAYLDLSYNLLQGGLPKSFGNNSLESLYLRSNNLTQPLPLLLQALSSGRAEKSLQFLDLCANQLSGSLAGIKRFSSLRELFLQDNQFINGSLHEAFGEFPSLEVLDLSGNQIGGSLPDFTLSPSLRLLRLDNNRFSGSLPTSIGRLSKLEEFSAYSNHLEGVVSEAHLLFNLSRLQVLNLSFNSLDLKFNSDWVPPFQLNSLKLAHCKLGSQFPRWLQTQKEIFELDISSAGISDAIPEWFWDQSQELSYLNLSHNQIYGMLPDLSLTLPNCLSLDLGSNNFSLKIPDLTFFPSAGVIDLSKNMFSGSISSLCNSIDYLYYLDLSDNLLSGEIPDCWENLGHVSILNLANNNLSGKIPTSIGSVSSLQSLHLRNNSFTGELPASLKNCTRLSIVDVGENQFSGEIPGWIGDMNLTVLSLSSNEFHGSIPLQICHLSWIQILDLSLNHISGTIPKCLNNLTAMAQKGSSTKTITHLVFDTVSPTTIPYDDKAFLVWKGINSEYKNILGLVKIILLSCNKLSGEIPPEITSLVGLVALNLSRNNLTGHISPKIGQLRLLNFLDLSRNQISGKIPTSLSQLSYLGILDLSNNNLSGRIPTGTQLQSFNASSYTGNPGLCGPPLTEGCPGDQAAQDPTIIRDSEVEDRFITAGFYISMGLGFSLGFWGVFGTLLIKDSWRYAYFKLLKNMEDWLYLTIAVNMVKLKRWFQS